MKQFGEIKIKTKKNEKIIVKYSIEVRKFELLFETMALAIVKIFEQCRIMFKRVLKDIMI